MAQHPFDTLKSPKNHAQSYDVTVGENSIVEGSLEQQGALEKDHKLYGSLRKGGAVDLFSRECAGLCAATFSSVFSFTAMQSVVRPLLVTHLYLTTQQQLAVQRLVELPAALCFLIGLLCDSRPLFGLRRKSYLLVGLVMNAAATVSLGALIVYIEAVHTSETESEREALDEEQNQHGGLVTVAILLTAIMSFGCLLTYLSVQTRTIELAQQEPLIARGSIIASYKILRRVSSLIAGIFTIEVAGLDGSTQRIALSTSLFLITAISVAPVPIILKYWEEQRYSLAVSLHIRGKILWKIVQQKAVWRILSFIAFFSLFLGIKFAETSNVVTAWAGASMDNPLVLRMISDCTMIVVVLVWRYVFMNRMWRTFFVWAPLFQIVPALIISAITAYDVDRNRYLYRGVISLTAISEGINQLTIIVPLTEVVQEGSEGATVGLAISLQRLIGVFVSTNTEGLFRPQNFYSSASILQDDSHAHDVVFGTLILNYCLNGLSLFGLLLLPSQKLDAQQMRSFGGFTKAAASTLAAFGVALLCYSMVMMILTFIPATACLKIVGGSGCG